MSDVKNCLSCRYQPDWDGESRCRFMEGMLPISFVRQRIARDTEKDRVYTEMYNIAFEILNDCPAYVPEDMEADLEALLALI